MRSVSVASGLAQEAIVHQAAHGQLWKESVQNGIVSQNLLTTTPHEISSKSNAAASYASEMRPPP